MSLPLDKHSAAMCFRIIARRSERQVIFSERIWYKKVELMDAVGGAYSLIT